MHDVDLRESLFVVLVMSMLSICILMAFALIVSLVGLSSIGSNLSR
jgi:hypothetical protein